MFDGYNPSKGNIDNFGDFNSEMHEYAMKEFTETYNLNNLVKDPTCFKNPLNPSLIDLILTNRSRSFQNTQTIETELSDHHKLIITVMRAFFPKQAPTIFTNRDTKHYDEDLFRNELLEELQNVNGGSVDCSTFVNMCTGVLNRYAPLK